MRSFSLFFGFFLTLALFSCAQNEQRKTKKAQRDKDYELPKDQHLTMEKDKLAVATFGNGCFWCTEAVFVQVEGVEKVVSGYSGGQIKNPTYREVCSGRTGHAEVVQIHYDPEKISYEDLLQIFWKTHDPTTLNRQGGDVGTQYRSVVFYHNKEQQEKAAYYKKELDEAGIWDDPIVTEISPFETFYAAEDYHQDYYALNKDKNPYCSHVITPKIEKFRSIFGDKMKKELK